jgi:hypothetical protein
MSFDNDGEGCKQKSEIHLLEEEGASEADKFLIFIPFLWILMLCYGYVVVKNCKCSGGGKMKNLKIEPVAKKTAKR